MELARVHLRGETGLLALLAIQFILPVIQLGGVAARLAYIGWLATFPCIIGIAWSNRRSPGMAVLGLGLLLNLVVIAANGGMPVFGAAAELARPGLANLAVPTSDFVHVLGASGTRLAWLADVMPLPGPSWLRSVASPGDCLLLVGVVVFLASADSSTGARPTALGDHLGSQ
jgi:hypothetical protein